MLNPNYKSQMQARKDVQKHNNSAKVIGLPLMSVPKQPNKYLPHYGAKEAAKYATPAPHRLGAAPKKVKRTRKVKETTNG